MEWKKIYFNKNNIKYETDKSVLIKMPRKSEFDGYLFWHPSKLVRQSRESGYRYTLSYTDEFEFRAFKDGANSKEKEYMLLTPSDIEEAFESDDYEAYCEYMRESYLVVTEPTKITDSVTVEEELMR